MLQQKKPIEVEVFVDENQRYWVGKGFVKGGLLPTDRGCFSSTDGSLKWKTIEDVVADKILLGRGWSYNDDYTGEADNSNTPARSTSNFHPSQKDTERCWMYATDFRPDNLSKAKPDRGMLHMVRYRTLSRTKIFHPEMLVPKEIYEKCDYCDSNAVDVLSNQLLEILTYCTLLHNSTLLTDAIALPLKKKVIDLAVSHVPRQTSDPKDSKFASTQLHALKRRLEKFADEEKTQTAKGRMFSSSSIDYSYSRCGNYKDFLDRKNQLANRAGLFHKIERDMIASLVVRKLDIYYQLHCNIKNCGIQCRFALVECPNDGCHDIVSRIHLESHDTTCAYKRIGCQCGDKFKRLELVQHQTHSCKLRPVHCPFQHVGCTKIVQERDLQQHLTEDINNHLLLAVNRLGECSKFTNDLESKVSQLETENMELKEALCLHKTEFERRISLMDKQLTKTTKSLSILETTCKKEFKKK